MLSLSYLYVLLYIVLSSQGIYYWLGPANALQHISIEAFIEQRKAIDLAIGHSLRVLYLLAVSAGLGLIILQINQQKSWWFAALLFSFACLSADLCLAITKSMPLNELFNRYMSGSHDLYGYEEARTNWLYFIRLRGAFIVAGLLVLLSAVRK